MVLAKVSQYMNAPPRSQCGRRSTSWGHEEDKRGSGHWEFMDQSEALLDQSEAFLDQLVDMPCIRLDYNELNFLLAKVVNMTLCHTLWICAEKCKGLLLYRSDGSILRVLAECAKKYQKDHGRVHYMPAGNLRIKLLICGQAYRCHVHDEVRWGGQKEGHEGRAWPGIWDNPKNVKRPAVGRPVKSHCHIIQCNLRTFFMIIQSDFELGQGRCCCQSACWHLSKPS